MSDSDDMDVDQDFPAVASPSSPVPSMPGNFSSPGGFDLSDSANGDASPIPPPHRMPTEAPPPPKTLVDAEACKAAGNKFFKQGDYESAIRQYTKGVLFIPCLIAIPFPVSANV